LSGAPGATADGKSVAFLKASNRVASYVADVEAGGARLANSKRITFEENSLQAVTDWTADSKTLILIRDRNEHYRVYKQSLASDTAEPIMAAAESGLGDLADAVLSPDQKWVLVEVFPAGSEDNTRTNVKIVRIPMTGGTPELLFSMRNGGIISCARAPSKLCAVAEESPDRKTMIVTAFDPVKGRGAELARFDLRPDANTGQTVAHLLLCNISPDGSRLAIARSSDGPIEIHSLRGQHTLIVRAKGLDKLSFFRWAADGKGLFVSRHLYITDELVHVDLKGRTHSLWKSATCFGTPSPDGHHIAITDTQQNQNVWMMENF